MDDSKKEVVTSQEEETQMDDSKKEVVTSQEEETHYARATADGVLNIYETAKNYTGIGKAACETVEGIVNYTGLVEKTGLDKHIPSAIDGLDSQINKFYLTGQITTKLQDVQEYFVGNLSEEYYQKIKDTLTQLKESITVVQSSIEEKIPKSNEFNQLFEQAISKSNQLIAAVLAIPGKDVFKTLPTSVTGAMDYIKATPTMFQKDSEQVTNNEQIGLLLNKMKSLVDSVNEVFGKPLADLVNRTTATTTVTIEATTSTTSTSTTATIITQKLQEFQGYLPAKLPEDYYQRIQGALGQLQESILNVQTIVKEKAPKGEDLKQLIEQAITKSNELVSAVLAIPEQDVLKSLPSSIATAIEYIKATPTLFQKDNAQITDNEQVGLLLNKMNSLVESVTEVFGKALSEASNRTATITSVSFSDITVLKMLQDLQGHFAGKLPEDYYQHIKSTLAQLQDSIKTVQTAVKEKTPKDEDLKRLFEQAIAKSNELVNAVLAIPGIDLQQIKLPSSISGAIVYIKATPVMFKRDSEQVTDKEQITSLIDKMNSLVESVTEVFGKVFVSTVTTTTTTTDVTTTTTTTGTNTHHHHHHHHHHQDSTVADIEKEGRLC